MDYTSKGRFYKSTFPVALAYAMIGHKSQLWPIISSKILINIQNAFAPILTHVMLSKVAEWKYLTIAQQLHISMIYRQLNIHPNKTWTR